MTIIWGWPLLDALGTAVPGESNFIDITELIWGLGWVRQALTSEADLFLTDALFVPFTTDLRLHAFGLLSDLMALPFTAVLGLVGAYNLILLLTLFLNGAVAFLFFRDEVDHSPAALTAAVWFMFSVPVLSQIGVGRASLGAMWIVIGSLWTFKRLLKRPRPLKGLLLGILLIAALLSDFQIFLFAAFWLIIYGLYQIVTSNLHLDIPVLTALGLALLTMTLPFVIIYLPALTGIEAAGFPRPGLSSMSFYSFELKHYFTLDLWPAVFGGYELVVTAVLAIVLFRRQGRHMVWLLGSVLFLILALGPILQPTNIPLPFAALSLLEPLRQFRTPFRMTMPVALGLAVVAAYALAYILPRLRPYRLLVPLLVLLIGGRLGLALALNPLVVQSYRAYDFYEQLAEEPGSYSLLEVPFGIRSGLERIGSGGERFQYYQHIHAKKLINGSVSRLPSAVFAFYRQHPSLLYLAGEETDATERELVDDLGEVLDWSEAGYVLVHRAYLKDETADAFEKFLDSHPRLTRLGLESDLVIYRTTTVNPPKS